MKNTAWSKTIMGNSLAYERLAMLWGHAMALHARNTKHLANEYGMYTQWLNFCNTNSLHPIHDIAKHPASGAFLVAAAFDALHSQAQELDKRQKGSIGCQVLSYMVVRTNCILPERQSYDELIWEVGRDTWAKTDPTRCLFIKDLQARLSSLQAGEPAPDIPRESLNDVYQKVVSSLMDDILEDATDDEEFCTSVVEQATNNPAVIRELRLMLRDTEHKDSEKVANIERVGAIYQDVGKFLVAGV